MNRLRAVVTVTATALELWLHGAGPLSRKAVRAPMGSLDPESRTWALEQWAALAATARLPWSTCLSRSLAMCRRASQRGLSCALRLGVVRHRPFFAHAWVQFEGLSLGEHDELPRLLPRLDR